MVVARLAVRVETALFAVVSCPVVAAKLVVNDATCACDADRSAFAVVSCEFAAARDAVSDAI